MMYKSLLEFLFITFLFCQTAFAMGGIEQELQCTAKSTWGIGTFDTVITPLGHKKALRQMVYDNHKRLIALVRWEHWPHGPNMVVSLKSVPVSTNDRAVMMYYIYHGCRLISTKRLVLWPL